MKYFSIVFKKELKDLSRNGLSLLLSIILPALLFPVLISLLLSAQEKINLDAKAVNVMLIDEQKESLLIRDATLYDIIKNNVFSTSDKINLTESNTMYQDLIEGKLDLLIEVKPIPFDNYINYQLTIIYNQSNSAYAKYVETLTKEIQTYSSVETLSRLSLVGLDMHATTPVLPILVGSNLYFDEMKHEGIFNHTLVVLIPMILLAFIAIGSTAYSGELFTMEKERHTLEALLTTKAPRVQIFFGKYVVIILISILSALVQFISLSITVIANQNRLGDLGFYLTNMSIFLIALSLLILCILSSTISTMIYVIGKSNKSVGAVSSIYALIPILLSYTTSFLMPSDVSLWHTMIPFYNTLLVTKLSIIGVTNIMYYIVSLLVNSFVSIIVLMYTIKVFKSERVLQVEE